MNEKKYKILTGDCRELLKTLPEKSIHMCVTSPPYWALRDYKTEPLIWDGNKNCKHEWANKLKKKNAHKEGETNPGKEHYTKDTGQWGDDQGQFCNLCGAWHGQLGLEVTPELFIQHLGEIFKEVKRVLRDDGTLWIVISDSYMSSGGGSRHHGYTDPKYKDGRKVEFFEPTAYPHKTIKPKDLVGIPWALVFALRADGWYLRQDIIWAKKNTMPESVLDRTVKSHEYIFLLSKSSKYFFDNEAIKEPALNNTPGRSRIGGLKTNHYITRNKRSVWSVSTKSYKGAHFATFPPDLIEPCILAGTSEKGCCPVCGMPWQRIVKKVVGDSKECPKTQDLHEARGGTGEFTGTVGKSGGGRIDGYTKTIGWKPNCKCGVNKDPIPCTVLDPFGGSGTTVGVALAHGRQAILCELNKEYTKLIPDRIADIDRFYGHKKQIKIMDYINNA